MIHKPLSILIVLLYAGIVFCATSQPYDKANCAIQLLGLSISHIQSPKDAQRAQRIVELLDQKCPTSSAKKLGLLAEEAAAQVPDRYYGWRHVCRQTHNDEPKCQYYEAYVQAAKELLYNPDAFFDEIRKISQQPLLKGDHS